MGSLVRTAVFVLLLSVTGFGQLPSSRCDSIGCAVAECPFLIASGSDGGAPAASISTDNLRRALFLNDCRTATPSGLTNDLANAFVSAPQPTRTESFHWGRPLLESFTFLAIEQAYVVHDDYRWVVVENGVPLNHYWRDYKQSLSTWVNSGWDDGDPKLYSYVGHPIQGALTGYIRVQNDPQGRALEFSNTKAYWWSRFKAQRTLTLPFPSLAE